MRRGWKDALASVLATTVLTVLALSGAQAEGNAPAGASAVVAGAAASVASTASTPPAASAADASSASSVVQVQVPVPLAQPLDRSADLAALRRGARMYATYCASCHAAASVRLGQLQALGLDRDDIAKSLNPTGGALSAPMHAAMPASAAQAAFGVVPPDLSTIVQVKGADWVYTYLRSFYTDPTRPMGGNNLLVPGVAMPDVLAGLRGPRTARFSQSAAGTRTFDGFTVQAPGAMRPADYDAALSDLVGYLSWLSDPSALPRHRLAPWVLGFLALFSFSAWRLTRAYWRGQKAS